VKKYKVKSLVVDSINNVSSYGVDIESELTKILSEQIAKEMNRDDRDILRYLGVEPDRNKRRINSINKIFI